jgi:hypothetical protein
MSTKRNALAGAAGCGIGLVAVLLEWWFLFRPHDDPSAGKPNSPAAAHKAWKVPDTQPSRPPELYGTIEKIRIRYSPATKNQPFIQCLVRAAKPQRAAWDSKFNARARQEDMPYWVGFAEPVRVVHGKSNSANLDVGQSISVWLESEVMFLTIPPQVVAEFIVIETRPDR